MSLLVALGKNTIPSVKEIIANVESASISGAYAKIVTKDKSVFYCLESEVSAIDTNPDKYVARHSAKHDAMFIVPQSSGGFVKF